MIVGLIGSVLMFCGDMILYYTPEDFDIKKYMTKGVEKKPYGDAADTGLCRGKRKWERQFR